LTMRTARSFGSSGYLAVVFFSMTPCSLPRYEASGHPRPVHLAGPRQTKQAGTSLSDGTVGLGPFEMTDVGDVIAACQDREISRWTDSGHRGGGGRESLRGRMDYSTGDRVSCLIRRGEPQIARRS
jgi:hypothetical protein